MANACSIRVRGVVQGVGFRPFVYRLARANTLTGWVLNGDQGVEIHLEGAEDDMEAFVEQMQSKRPSASTISEVEVTPALSEGLNEFTIRESHHIAALTVQISSDLPVCEDCLKECFNPSDPRYRYPYINCTNCGPRYSVILALPYDRANTTMTDWPMDAYCDSEYRDPLNRRFHAQPVACSACGPNFILRLNGVDAADGWDAIRKTAELLWEGSIVAIKGLGGYHLACDARNPMATVALRTRKFRKEKPFALMVRDVEVASRLVLLTSESEIVLTSLARPILLAQARLELEGVAPNNRDLGVMLPSTPLHHLLFAAGAPEALVMTSANRSNEPIAYEDADALKRLSGIADAFLIGERPIARRVDDSIARVGAFGLLVLRRSRGYAPGRVAKLPTKRPVLALGADLKNTITLVVDGNAFVSQHIGDLSHYQAFQAFTKTIEDLISMYDIDTSDLLLAHDCHPQYASTKHAAALPAYETRAIQHHRAHLASVLAERGEWEKSIVGVSFDGTGFGDDGSIWGGEIFVGSLEGGFERTSHLRSAALPGGDGAAQYPMQAASGFLAQIGDLPDLTRPPFNFTSRYEDAMQLIRREVRTFSTTSVGRLFDAAAALLGFVRESTFEGQAAIWLEQLARDSSNLDAYPFPLTDDGLDFRPLLNAVVRDRLRGRTVPEVARAFQHGVAEGTAEVVVRLCHSRSIDTVVLSGGVFQNELLLEDLQSLLEPLHLEIWTNHDVPPNDGGISLGQAALAAFGNFNDAERNISEGVAHA
ncbi:carbamoyltransferase HypF [Tunturibacter psychrotolerans]|uniref:Carbamoyltransferase n=1 Tax=Tunturiibacter psychrotolerans TaxID=3069686 RepID=A0AAU7ZUC7_9BACT